MIEKERYYYISMSNRLNRMWYPQDSFNAVTVCENGELSNLHGFYEENSGEGNTRSDYERDYRDYTLDHGVGAGRGSCDNVEAPYVSHKSSGGANPFRRRGIVYGD